MNYKVASTLDEILDAWCVVYKQYLKAAFISPNDMSVFTFPEYLNNNTAVVYGEKMGKVVCTASGVLDSKVGLPLDAYFKRELNQLRSQGRKLIEVGLLADMRGNTNVNNIIDLISAISKFGGYSGHHDYVIGVNPRRMNFFSKVFGVQHFGDLKDYGKLKSAPVALMHVQTKDLEVNIRQAIARIYTQCMELDFDKRYKFNRDNSIHETEFDHSVDTFMKLMAVPNQSSLVAA